MAKHHTKDEQFMICLYENAQQANDVESVFNRYTIGLQIGLHERGIDAICKLLVQANFIKKEGQEGIYLTKHGINLAETLIDE